MDEATQKGLATRQRRWEARNEKRRLKALEEEAKAAKIKAEDEKYMKEAIKQAKKASQIGDVPIGCVLVKMDRSLQEAITGETQIKRFFPTLRSLPLKKPVKKKGTGVWKIVHCM